VGCTTEFSNSVAHPTSRCATEFFDLAKPSRPGGGGYSIQIESSVALARHSHHLVAVVEGDAVVAPPSPQRRSPAAPAEDQAATPSSRAEEEPRGPRRRGSPPSPLHRSTVPAEEPRHPCRGARHDAVCLARAPRGGPCSAAPSPPPSPPGSWYALIHIAPPQLPFYDPSFSSEHDTPQ
jgi:hypothetical protein